MQEPYPPARAFSWGLIAGASVVFLGAVAALFLGEEESSAGLWILILAPLFGGAAAAGLPAFKLGALDSRIFAVSFAAFICSLLLSWMVEYVLLLDVFTDVFSSKDTMEMTSRFFWTRYVALSVLAIPAGALIGMNFGRPPSF